jgi:hypothetical protein
MRMDVLTSETCRALNNEIKKQVTSSWSLFIQPSKLIKLYNSLFHNRSILCRINVPSTTDVLR